MKQVIVIGAGAAGLMAGCAACDAGAGVTVLEHNEKAGKKIYITGKGRCNYTNACENEDFFRNVLRNPKFLYSAVYSFDSTSVTAFLNQNGCATKEERGKRCFPESDHAFDVTDALVRHLKARGAGIRFRTQVQEILINSEGGAVTGVQLADGRTLSADAVILATGGMSYTSTGSTGDGYHLAEKLGHTIQPLRPSLVPLTTQETWPMELQGLALRNVAVRLEPRDVAEVGGSDKEEPGGEKTARAEADAALTGKNIKKGKRSSKKKKAAYEGFGELLFTHFGISGPLVLSASCHADFDEHPHGYVLHLDLKPSMTQEELAAKLTREFSLAPKKELRNALKVLLPERMAEIAAELYAKAEQHPSAEGGAARPVYTLNERELLNLAGLLKDLQLHVTGTRGFQEAIVTRGGVSTKEINPSTMESRKVRGLYFAGEVMDVDAYTGGFNLQIAWSTGHLAGESAAEMAADAR